MEQKQIALLECKADDSQPGSFSGYGAVFGNIDSYGDVIDRGAFARTLTAWQEERGKWPKMLLQHGGWGVTSEDLMPIGQWTHMEENRRGLKVKGQLFGMQTEKGQYIYEGLTSRELDGLSIGYETRNAQDEVIDGETIRHLTDIELWEVSLVTFPANVQALVSSVKGMGKEKKRELEEAFRKGGLSRTASVEAVAILTSWLQRDAGAPTTVLREAVTPGTCQEMELLRWLHQQADDAASQILVSHLQRSACHE